MNRNHFSKKICMGGWGGVLLVQLLVVQLVEEIAAINYTSHVSTVLNQENADYCMLLLDSPIRDDTFFLELWKNAAIRGVVDGGANVLYDDYEPDHDKEIMPTFVSGDLTSIRFDVKHFLKEEEVEIIETADQNETDMYKALQVLAGRPEAESKCKNVYVYSEQSQRVDRNEGNKDALFKAANTLSQFNVSILSYTNMMWVMPPDVHTIEIPEQISSPKLKCGLLPYAGQSHVKTTGLKWDLDGAIKFGDKISSSNTYDQSTVTVDTDNYILWTMELPNDE